MLIRILIVLWYNIMASTREYLIVTLEYQPEDRTYRGA